MDSGNSTRDVSRREGERERRGGGWMGEEGGARKMEGWRVVERGERERERAAGA